MANGEKFTTKAKFQIDDEGVVELIVYRAVGSDEPILQCRFEKGNWQAFVRDVLKMDRALKSMEDDVGLYSDPRYQSWNISKEDRNE